MTKIKFFLVSLFLLFMMQSIIGQKDCTFPVTGWPALTDFEPGQSFMGLLGGLYGDNLNEKSGQYRNDALFYASQIRPLNKSGQYDPNGKIGFMGVGASNPRTEFNAFANICMVSKIINPKISWINSCIGGQGIQKMNQMSDSYWVQASKLLDSLGLSPQQVQVIWIETENTANGNTKFPDCAQELGNEYLILLKTIRNLFPNVKICYLSARAFSGFALPVAGGVGKGLLHPRDYYNGWTIRFLIEKIIAKENGYLYNGNQAEIPFTTWGNYSWTDGESIRKDGFYIDCDTDFGDDGLHLTAQGEQKIGQLMYDFFSEEESAKPWFFENTSTSVYYEKSDVSDIHLKLINGIVQYTSSVSYAKAIVINANGAIVREFNLNKSSILDLQGIQYGIYWLRFYNENNGWTDAKSISYIF